MIQRNTIINYKIYINLVEDIMLILFTINLLKVGYFGLHKSYTRIFLWMEKRNTKLLLPT